MKKIINLFDDEHWEVANGYPQGTMAKVLRDSKDAKTVLLKLPKGFFMAPHSHLTTEQNFLIEGEYESAGESYSAGSYQIFSPRDEHGPFESKNGALVLVVYDSI
ncbi:MAG: cupin domain-containing protein [Bacteroidetes bacterium]|nr:cupin domain-containing protein [Bacteroidota bacterium]